MFMNVDAYGGASLWCDLLAIANISQPRCGRVDKARWQNDSSRNYRSCEGTASYLVYTGDDLNIPIEKGSFILPS